MKEIDVAVRDATLSLQVIHTSLTEGMHVDIYFCICLYCSLPHDSLLILVSDGCLKARAQFEVCRNLYEKLAKLVPTGEYYITHLLINKNS